jgi:alkanesulfonate monooxygenase SsuD/methylene tetrahydromethanopterin reductase-like flavin-dependent oxidoreductase (luciferase family)
MFPPSGDVDQGRETLDHLTGGRVELALGGGEPWAGAAAVGVHPPAGERVAQFTEFVELVDLLLRQPGDRLPGPVLSVRRCGDHPAADPASPPADHHRRARAVDARNPITGNKGRVDRSVRMTSIGRFGTFGAGPLGGSALFKNDHRLSTG